MTTDTIWIAAIVAFFGLFGVTLFVVSLWSGLEPAKAKRSETIPARRPSIGEELAHRG